MWINSIPSTSISNQININLLISIKAKEITVVNGINDISGIKGVNNING